MVSVITTAPVFTLFISVNNFSPLFSNINSNVTLIYIYTSPYKHSGVYISELNSECIAHYDYASHTSTLVTYSLLCKNDKRHTVNISKPTMGLTKHR